jgi:predicted DCC family thiol-disulfide oxidoreductase YuxK
MPATVIYDGDCGLCTRVKEITEALDWLGTMRWIPLQSPEAARFGIPIEELRDSVFLVSDRSVTHGWSAVKGMALRVPLTYIGAAFAIRRTRWAALGLALLFSPLAEPAGRAAYSWVARNRHRLWGSTCGLPVWDNRSK